jgi:hypothetical protein
MFLWDNWRNGISVRCLSWVLQNAGWSVDLLWDRYVDYSKMCLCLNIFMKVFLQ